MATNPTANALAVRQAIRTVARRVFANAVAEDPVSPEWENYPEVAEDDWQAVMADVWHLAERADVETEKYESAYRYLAARAEGVPA